MRRVSFIQIDCLKPPIHRLLLAEIMFADLRPIQFELRLALFRLYLFRFLHLPEFQRTGAGAAKYSRSKLPAARFQASDYFSWRHCFGAITARQNDSMSALLAMDGERHFADGFWLSRRNHWLFDWSGAEIRR